MKRGIGGVGLVGLALATRCECWKRGNERDERNPKAKMLTRMAARRNSDNVEPGRVGRVSLLLQSSRGQSEDRMGRQPSVGVRYWRVGKSGRRSTLLWRQVWNISRWNVLR